MKDIQLAQRQLPCSGYEHLTYPSMRPLLSSADYAERVIAIAASHAGNPIGLLLLSDKFKVRDSDTPTRRLLSIMVSPQWRRQGLAGRLLTMGQTQAAKSGTQRLMGYHSDRMKQTHAYLGLLEKHGWQAPELLQYRLSGYAGWAQGAEQYWSRFFQRMRRQGFQAVPWDGLNSDQYAQVQTLCETADMGEEDHLSAFHWEKKSDPGLSVALLRGDEPVGWIFAQWNAIENSAHYTCGYVKPELQKIGWLIAGIAEVCRRQSALYGAKSVAMFETMGDNEGMQRFMKKRLKDRWALATDHRYVSNKWLRAPTGQASF